MAGASDSSLPPRLIVGLGNPGRQYQDTRHNIGFMALDRLVDGATWDEEKRWKTRILKRGNTWFLKPLTYMNLSGESVSAVSRFYRIPMEEILVVYDDMDLPLGKLRLRKNGSAGGHNGIKSIIQHLGGQDFPRLKLGIGRDDRKSSVTGHVLGKFAPEEREIVEKTLQDATRALECALARGVDTAMNQFNRKEKPPKKARPTAPQPSKPTAGDKDDSGSHSKQQDE